MIETNEPRALAAALSGPVFTPRGHAMQAAERHVERWAPEASTERVRPLRNLGFADRLVSPWIETAQRSVSHLQRLFGPLAGDETSGGQPDHASWLFPRPSFQDELDWMAAARQPQRDPQQASPLGLPVSLHDYIAPSLAKGGRAPFARSLTAFEGVLGPRLVMPVGLGGLVAMVNHNLAVGGAGRRGGFAAPQLRVPTLQALIPAMTLVATVAHQFGKPRPKTSAFAAVQEAAPAALQHVAWSDRWLARFAGARDASLDLLAAPKPFEAPELVLMAPRFDATARPVVKRMVAAPQIRRYDDNEATPDDVFTEVAVAAARVHSGMHGRTPPRPAAPMVRRDSVADAIAHAVPAAPDAGVSAQLASSPFAPAFRHILPLAAAPVFDVRSIDSSGLSVAYLAGVLAPSSGLVVAGAALGGADRAVAREGFDWSPTFVATTAPVQRAEESAEPVTARSALLAPETRPVVARGRARTVADAMVSAMALPLLSEALDESPGTLDISGVHQHVATYAAPGMIAERAHAWSVAQERSTSDLAYDFVPPELVLAARVYGLGPAEASQAMRLAAAGPGQLVAMAGTVDRTFVQVLQVEADRRDQARIRQARPAASAPVAHVEYEDASDAPAPVTSTATFGVDRRQPRGSFMWPAAAVAALGMTASPPEGDQLMPVAALELLAASAVAQLGTYAVLGDGRSTRRPELSLTVSSAVDRPQQATGVATDLSADTSMPAQQRAAFEALYVAMEKSRDPQSSLAADAARAVALAGRGDSTISATERAQAAWGVLPLVALRPGGPDGRSQLPRFADSTATPSRAAATDIAAERSGFGMPVVRGPGESVAFTGDMALYAPPASFVESRPGMAQLSARAGEAISSYVTPVVVASQSQDAEARAAAAAAEIMRPGRSAGRFGGGETEIPTWFESAARKLLSERGGSEGLSLAELTLVNAAPVQQVAAAEEHSTAPTPQQAAPAAKPEFSQADVDNIATRVLRIVYDMIEAAKTRGGMYV